MRFVTTLAATAAFTIAGIAAQAGGLEPVVVEPQPVVVEEAPAPAGSSISPTYIVVGVLAALLIAAAVSAEDDDD